MYEHNFILCGVFTFILINSTNPYLLQASIIAAGLYGLDNKIDPGEPLSCNMYTDYKKYPDLEKLPNDIEESLNELDKNKTIRSSFGDDVINSYIKLKRKEIEDFDQKDNFLLNLVSQSNYIFLHVNFENDK